MSETYAIELKNITKRFGKVTANDKVCLSVKKGEILSILGENGSGKTTLMNMISGIYYPDEGQILVNGKEVTIRSPKDSFALGIGMIHQHFKLVDVLTAAENIILGLPGKEVLDMKSVAAKINELTSRYGFDLDPNQKIYTMSVSQKQTVEIVKLLYRGVDILILDEPTAVLTPQETEKLFTVLRNMREAGHSIIIITHKLHGLDVFGHGGADAAYRGEIICIPEKELELVLISNTTTYAMSKLADKAACIVLGLPDCTEPAVPEHENAPARSGVFLTALPDDPMFVDIAEQNGTFYMQREWCRTELVKEEDGGYRIGSLDEKIYFTDKEILYRLPARVLTLTPAKPADPALFQEGTYYNDETDSFMKLVKVENTCEIHMRRYGKTTLYQSGSGSIIFRMDANLVMYVKAENDTIIMDGGRVKHIIYQKQ